MLLIRVPGGDGRQELGPLGGGEELPCFRRDPHGRGPGGRYDLSGLPTLLSSGELPDAPRPLPAMMLGFAPKHREGRGRPRPGPGEGMRRDVMESLGQVMRPREGIPPCPRRALPRGGAAPLLERAGPEAFQPACKGGRVRVGPQGDEHVDVEVILAPAAPGGVIHPKESQDGTFPGGGSLGGLECGLHGACQSAPGVLRGMSEGQGGVEVSPGLVDAVEAFCIGPRPSCRQRRGTDGACHPLTMHQPAGPEAPVR